MSEQPEYRFQVLKKLYGKDEWVDVELPTDSKVAELAARIVDLEGEVQWWDDYYGQLCGDVWKATGAKGDYEYPGQIVREVSGMADDMTVLREKLKLAEAERDRLAEVERERDALRAALKASIDALDVFAQAAHDTDIEPCDDEQWLSIDTADDGAKEIHMKDYGYLAVGHLRHAEQTRDTAAAALKATKP